MSAQVIEGLVRCRFWHRWCWRSWSRDQSLSSKALHNNPYAIIFKEENTLYSTRSMFSNDLNNINTHEYIKAKVLLSITLAKPSSLSAWQALNCSGKLPPADTPPGQPLVSDSLKPTQSFINLLSSSAGRTLSPKLPLANTATNPGSRCVEERPLGVSWETSQPHPLPTTDVSSFYIQHFPIPIDSFFETLKLRIL